MPQKLLKEEVGVKAFPFLNLNTGVLQFKVCYCEKKTYEDTEYTGRILIIPTQITIGIFDTPTKTEDFALKYQTHS
jgi:hypothetical protein